MVEGRVSFDNGSRFLRDDLMIELRTLTGEQVSARTAISLEGDFEFDSVPPGDYELRVTDTYGNAVYSEPVSISEEDDVLSVTLPSVRLERPVSGTVSLATLEHKVPGKALKEFKKSESAARKGKVQKSIRHLQKALAIDPLYLDAYNNLGVRYLSLKDYDAAIGQFRKAVNLEPGFVPARANLGIALVATQRYAEAEQEARRTLKTDPTSLEADFVLGLSLHAQNQHRREALEALDLAGPRFPYARLAAAEILTKRGDNKKAVEELKEFLRTSNGEHRAQVEAWLRRLQNAN